MLWGQSIRPAHERRRHPRMPYLDARWVGAQATGASFVSDISLGGCCVHSKVVPPSRELVTIVVEFGGGEALSLRGRVVAPRRTDAFGAVFVDVNTETTARLRQLLERLAGGIPAGAGLRHGRAHVSATAPR